MKIDNKMVLDDSTTARYFDEIIDLATAYHPHYFIQDEVYDLVVEIKKVRLIIELFHTETRM